MRRPVRIAPLVDQLRDLGVAPGGVLLVHTAFSAVAPLREARPGFIEALRAVLGLEEAARTVG